MSVLSGKVALVTGGARGIGRAICEAYAAAGAKVAIADLDRDEALAAAREIGSSAMGLAMDVSDRQAVADGVAAVSARWGDIDVLVNNAGTFTMSRIGEIGEDEYRRLFDVNVAGTLWAIQAVVPGMRAKGGGAIVNFASQAGRRGEPNITLYCATKAAVISLTQSLALELAPHGIRVNGIAPGVVDTPMWDVVDAKFAVYEGKPEGQKKREVGEAVPLGRMGVPAEIADPCVFLASDAARYVTAQTLNVDGGNWMS